MNSPVLEQRVVPEKPSYKNVIIKFSLSAIISIFAVVFYVICSNFPEWVADSYVHFSRAFQYILSAPFSILPFSVAEFALYALIAASLAKVIQIIVLSLKHRYDLRKLLRFLSSTTLAASILLGIFLVGWAANYHSAGLAYALELDARPRDSQTLAAALDEIVAELNAAARTLPTDSNNETLYPDFAAQAELARDAWAALADIEPYFADTAPRAPKRVAASRLMSRFGITGIYFPLTAEANVNADSHDSGRIFTMAHELAHSLGVAPENDANFAAFLACRASDNSYARYSGYLAAFVYCYNALVGADQDAAFERWYALDDAVIAEIQARNAYWKQFEGPAKAVGTAVNNAYLQTMSQPDGVQSYGRVVDLILADYAKRH